VQFRRGGIIETLPIENGKHVQKGNLLAVLDNQVQKLALSKAKINVDEKLISYKDLMLSYRSVKDTAGLSNITQNIRISSGLATAEIAYQEARFEYENSFVRAPISGVISAVELGTGAVVNDNPFLCFIHDPDNLLIATDVLESDAIQLRKGIDAEVTPTAMRDQIFRAQIENVNPRVDAKTGMVKVILRLMGRPRVLPGMNVQVTMKLPFDKHIIVPREAILVRSGKHVVFTVRNNLAKWNYVTVGRENGKEIEVLEGLTSGDSVIIDNNLQLAHDAVVSVKNK
jgi:RND family efflux transporter MFP subunit